MARLLAITYGAVTLGNGATDSNTRLTGKYSYAQDYDAASLTFEVFVTASTPSAFVASEATLLAEFRKIDQTLSVALDGSSRASWTHALNTGFNARPSIRKIPGPDNTAYSARYSCSVRVALPADLAGRNFRKSSSVDVSTDAAGKRRVGITATYTADSSTPQDARAALDADFDTFCAAQLTAVGVTTAELIDEPRNENDDQDKTATASRIYEEIKFNQKSGTLNATEIKQPRLAIRRVDVGSRGVGLDEDVVPLAELVVSYSAIVPFSESTDLDNVYKTTIREFILSEAREQTDASNIIITRESATYDAYNNSFQVEMSLLADVGGKFYSGYAQWQIRGDVGLVFRPVWNGDKFARDIYQGHATHMLTLTRQTTHRYPGGKLLGSEFPNMTAHIPPSFGPEWIEVRESRKSIVTDAGIVGETMQLQRLTTAFVYLRVNVVHDARFGSSDNDSSEGEPGTTGTTRERGSSGGDAGGGGADTFEYEGILFESLGILQADGGSDGDSEPGASTTQ